MSIAEATPTDEHPSFGDTYQMCCGQCGQGLCYVDEMTGANSEGWGWQRD